MNKIFVLVILCIALVASEKIKGVRRTRHIVKRQAGGGCLYEGQVYQQGQTWTVPCKYNCVCKDGTAGRYSCTEVCPHYDTLPDGCFMQQDPNNQCCTVPKCNFQPGGGTDGGGVITGTSGSSGGMGSGGGTPVLSMGSGSGHSGSFMSGGSCHDTINNCANYGQTVCTDPQYTQWVKQNCAQYCNQCGGSSGGIISGHGSGGVVSGGGSGGVVSGGGSGGMVSGGGSGGMVSGGGSGGMVSGGGSSHTGGTDGGDGGFSLHFGTGGSGGTGGTMVTCNDAIQNCAAYGKTVCSDPQYDQWVSKNCANYCNRCGSTGTMTGGTGTMTGGTGTMTGGTGTMTGGTGTMTGGTGMVPVLQPDGTYIGTGGPGISGTGGTGSSGGTIIGTGGSGFSGTGGTGSSGSGGTGSSGETVYGPGGTIIGTGGSGISGSGGTGSSGETVYVPGGGTGGTGGGTGGTGSMTGGTGTMAGGTGTMTGGGMCADAINNCANYGQGVCTDPTYADWVSKNCQAYCHKCSGGTMTGGTMTGTGGAGGTIYYPGGTGTGGGTITGTGGSGGTITGTGTGSGGSMSGTSTGCVYKDSVYQQGQTWKDGCTYSCTCVEAATGKYTCTGLCVQWNLPPSCSLNPPGPGKCCQTPNCPSNVQIQYPPGYVEQ